MAARSRGISTAALVLLIVVVAIAVAAAYFAIVPPGGTAPTSVTIQTVQVKIPDGAAGDESLSFEPQVVTVVIGVNNTVQWKNFDSVAHTVTSTSVPSGAQPFGSASNLVEPGQAFTITFTVPGTYQYHCVIHPHMEGTIIVKEG